MAFWAVSRAPRHRLHTIVSRLMKHQLQDAGASERVYSRPNRANCELRSICAVLLTRESLSICASSRVSSASAAAVSASHWPLRDSTSAFSCTFASTPSKSGQELPETKSRKQEHLSSSDSFLLFPESLSLCPAMRCCTTCVACDNQRPGTLLLNRYCSPSQSC